ncbi:TIGR03619 family F420-dependent LLM class oxidoreductase [Nocardia alni]|uniref:TIGR03619 family F420-dependent LLM class oxidoreductase n=1 Tax=Nocardia alni TaxID=2815723 RepID=UPI001C216DB3|nr:TIGR03619 family F420-dependent LLM class oxidoreductase [Nocardia alni]
MSYENRRSVGLAIPNMGTDSPDTVRDLPRIAEDLGYDSVWVTDHLVGLRATDDLYGSHWMEALTALTWVAATTTTIRVGTGVLVVPYRHPVLTAKMLATVDVLSGGRLDVGIGTGWSRTEYRAVGAGDLFAERGAATDEALDLMLACWRGGPIEHDGPHFPVRHVQVQPRPAQHPHPPIWVGGNGPAAMRRAARIADVWHPWDLTPAELAEQGHRLDDIAGRAVARSIRLNLDEAALDRIDDLVDGYLEAGAVRVVVEFRGRNGQQACALAQRAAKALFG